MAAEPTNKPLECCICNDGTLAVRVVNRKGYCKLHQHRAFEAQKKAILADEDAKERRKALVRILDGKRDRRTKPWTPFS